MSAPRDLSRRELFRSVLRPRSVALAAAAGGVWTFQLEEAQGTPFAPRPPGALAEPEFLAACIKCGQCVEACPFDTLELATAEADPVIGTPYFVPREVPCYMCEDSPCTVACPTGALDETVAIDDATMGLAVLVDHETCLAYQGLRCEVCYRACPLLGEAITLEFRPQERTGKHAYFIPVVNSDACTGCGRCEHACVTEEAAIKVLPLELAKGKLDETYRFGWTEEPVVSRDFEAPTSAPDIPEFEGSLERVLEEMSDLSGIVEP